MRVAPWSGAEGGLGMVPSPFVPAPEPHSGERFQFRAGNTNNLHWRKGWPSWPRLGVCHEEERAHYLWRYKPKVEWGQWGLQEVEKEQRAGI